MSKTQTAVAGQRVSVQLDPGMLVEDLILQRFQSLPKRRQPEWIRSLLVQGFLAESRLIRQLKGAASQTQVVSGRVKQSRGSGFDFRDWIGRSAKLNPVASFTAETLKEDPPYCVQKINSTKPFAHLRKVVG
ncbi:MAG: hypothetical protein KDI27_14410 [Gammaproteobacteria bacterium]|nr:hypothetical protein [Gammaproteobacteria bacterium]